MIRGLGGFTTVADRKHARRVALTSGLLLFAIGAGASLRLGNFYGFLASAVAGALAFAVHRQLAIARAPKGTLDLEDDSRVGVVLTLRRGGDLLFRVPLKQAKIVGRTRAMRVGAVRFQLQVQWDDGVFVGSLAVPFRGATDDVEGVLPTTIDLDRMASRALDALSYEIAEKKVD